MDDYITVTRNAKGPMRYGEITLQEGVPTRVPRGFVELYGGPSLHFDFSQMADELRSTTGDGRPYFDFWAPLSVIDGYGRHALDIWRAMRLLGADARLRNPGHFVDRSYLDADVIAQRNANNAALPAKVALAMTVPYDDMIWDSQSLAKIAITQFETDRIPDFHAEQVNRCDHLITTSPFQVPIWKKAGVRCPISVLTAGVDTDYFSYTERSNEGPFRVLILGALTERKNWQGAIRIFQAASEGDQSWELTIKTRRTVAIHDITAEALKDRRIRLIQGDSPPEHVRQLYHEHHCFLWPSKGEGTGLPPIEAMSTGMEVVCADNSGMRAYLDPKWSYPIKTEGKEYAGPPRGFGADYVSRYGDVGNWWIPSEKDGVKQLRDAYALWRGGCGKGQAAAEYVRANHTLADQGLSVLKVVEEYL